MLIGHLSDTHLGVRPYDLREREEDFYNSFNQAIDIIFKEHVKAIIHAGDIFDTPRPTGTALVTLANKLKDLRERGIRFFFTLGEHDISRVRGIPASFLYDKVDLATYIGSGEPVVWENLLIAGLHKHRKHEVDKFKTELGKINAFCSSKGATKKILVLHQGLKEFHEYGGEITHQDLPNNFDYYAMGHLHDKNEAQFPAFKGPICYPGSTDIINLNERETKKGFYLVDLSTQEAKPQWIELKTRKHMLIDLNYDTLENSINDLLTKLKREEKKPMVKLRIKGRDIDVSKVISLSRKLEEYTLYHNHEYLNEEISVSMDHDRSAGIEQQMLRMAEEILGDKEKALFALNELLPSLLNEEALDLLWDSYKKDRFKVR